MASTDGQVFLYKNDPDKLLTQDFSKTNKVDENADFVTYTHPKMKVCLLLVLIYFGRMSLQRQRQINGRIARVLML